MEMFFCRGCDRMRHGDHVHKDSLLGNFEAELSDYTKKMRGRPLKNKNTPKQIVVPFVPENLNDESPLI